MSDERDEAVEQARPGLCNCREEAAHFLKMLDAIELRSPGSVRSAMLEFFAEEYGEGLTLCSDYRRAVEIRRVEIVKIPLWVM
jgi:hypothetical protein